MSTHRGPGESGADTASRPSASEAVDDPGHTLARPSLLARRLQGLRRAGPVRRRQKEMTPAGMKDSTYWDKRRKNNEAARRSRERRRLSDLMLEGQLVALSEENARLRARVFSLQRRSGVRPEGSVMASALSHAPPLHPAGPSASTPSSVLGLRLLQTHPAPHPFETRPPYFYSTNGPGGGFTPPGALQHPSTLPYAPHSWLAPHRSPSPGCNNLLQPRWSPCAPPPAVFTGLPLYIQGRHVQGVAVEPDVQRGLKGLLMHHGQDGH